MSLNVELKGCGGRGTVLRRFGLGEQRSNFTPSIHKQESLHLIVILPTISSIIALCEPYISDSL